MTRNELEEHVMLEKALRDQMSVANLQPSSVLLKTNLAMAVQMARALQGTKEEFLKLAAAEFDSWTRYDALKQLLVLKKKEKK